MTKPLAFEGSLVDVKNINMHKVVRLSIDVPAEFGERVIDAFGWPTMVSPVSVAIARLNQKGGDANTLQSKPGDATKPDADPAPASGERKRHFSELPLSQQSALACEKPEFWRYLQGEYCVGDDVITCGEDAAQGVRELCNVKSRREFDTDHEAAKRWRNLYGAFEAEKLAEQHGRR
jgi:hypothetical protein